MKSFIRYFLQSLFVFAWLAVILGCTAKNNSSVFTEIGDDGFLRHLGQGVCQDIRNGRMWQVEREGLFHTFQEAQEYAANLRLKGHTDWRLPTKEELFDLYQIFYWHNNGECDLKYNGDYWATFDEGKPIVGNWESYYVCGPEFRFIKSLRKKGYVRAVRQ